VEKKGIVSVIDYVVTVTTGQDRIRVLFKK
jgi:hypothetical protein